MPAVREVLWKPGNGPGLNVVTLEVDGARCRIAPQLGFNCLSWEVETSTGWRELLWTAPDIDVNPVATRSGIPILFPFPNRIRDGRFTWEGKQYQLPNNSQGKHAIHGFVCYRPWNVRHADASFLEARFDSQDFEDLRESWPSTYRCRAWYTLNSPGPKCLQLDFQVENTGDSDLPFGLGTHPYWRVNANDAKILLCRMPKGRALLKAWVLNDLLPTGEFRSLTPAEEKVLTGAALGSDVLDTVLQTENNSPLGTFWSLAAPLQSHDAVILTESPEVFGTFVLFTPQHREAVCIEPYTCTTDAVNLEAKGIASGLLRLKPGQVWQTQLFWHSKLLPRKGSKR
jgi:aldose 1-epimerase